MWVFLIYSIFAFRKNILFQICLFFVIPKNIDFVGDTKKKSNIFELSQICYKSNGETVIQKCLKTLHDEKQNTQ